MNEVTHSNRGQRQKDEVRAGERENESQNQAKYTPLCTIGWRRKREMDERGVDRQERVRSWRSGTKGQSSL